MSDAPQLNPNLTGQEQEAVEQAYQLFGADAKLQATEFLSMLPLDPAIAQDTLDGISSRIDAMPDYQDRAEVANHFKALAQIVGRYPLSATATLVAVQTVIKLAEPTTTTSEPLQPSEPAVPPSPSREEPDLTGFSQVHSVDFVPPIDEVEVVTVPEAVVEVVESTTEYGPHIDELSEPLIDPDPQPDTDPASLDVSKTELDPVLDDPLAEDAREFTDAQQRLVRRVFGRSADKVLGMTKRQFEQLLEKVFDAFIDVPNRHMPVDARYERKEMVFMFFEGKSWGEISQFCGKNPGNVTTTIMQNLADTLNNNVGRETIERFVDETLLDDDSDQTQETLDTGKPEDEDVVDGFEATLNQAADLLLVKKHEFAAFKRIFDPDVKEPAKGETENELRDGLQMILNLVQADPNLDQAMKLDNLEVIIFSYLVGGSKKTGEQPVLPPYSISKREQALLSTAKQNVNDVIAKALDKLVRARQYQQRTESWKSRLQS